MIIEDQKFTPYKDGLAVIPHKEETTSVSADEMFKELRYSKKENEFEIRYSYIDEKEYYNDEDIVFYKREKAIEIYHPECREDYESDSGVISMQELQAINEKCKELGWI